MSPETLMQIKDLRRLTEAEADDLHQRWARKLKEIKQYDRVLSEHEPAPCPYVLEALHDKDGRLIHTRHI